MTSKMPLSSSGTSLDEAGSISAEKSAFTKGSSSLMRFDPAAKTGAGRAGVCTAGRCAAEADAETEI